MRATDRMLVERTPVSQRDLLTAKCDSTWQIVSHRQGGVEFYRANPPSP